MSTLKLKEEIISRLNKVVQMARKIEASPEMQEAQHEMAHLIESRQLFIDESTKKSKEIRDSIEHLVKQHETIADVEAKMIAKFDDHEKVINEKIIGLRIEFAREMTALEREISGALSVPGKGFKEANNIHPIDCAPVKDVHEAVQEMIDSHPEEFGYSPDLDRSGGEAYGNITYPNGEEQELFGDPIAATPTDVLTRLGATIVTEQGSIRTVIKQEDIEDAAENFSFAIEENSDRVDD